MSLSTFVNYWFDNRTQIYGLQLAFLRFDAVFHIHCTKPEYKIDDASAL